MTNTIPNLLIFYENRKVFDILNQFLSPKRFTLTYCDNISDAMNMINQRKFSAVITDMNHFDLLKNALFSENRSEKFLPFIAITDISNPKLLKKVVFDGADAVVSKFLNVSTFCKALAKVIDITIGTNKANIKEYIHFSLHSKLEFLKEINKFMFQVLKEKNIPQLANDCIRLAVDEICSNAIEHGNKNDPEKIVELSYLLYDDRIEFVVMDEGEGFEPDLIPDPTKEDTIFNSRGRGLYLASSIMDEMKFELGGRKITLIKYFKKSNKNKPEITFSY